MATERLSMRKTREILRLKWSLGRSHRDVAGSLGVSLGVVTATVQRAVDAQLDWAQAQGLTEEALEKLLFPKKEARGALRPAPDCAYLHVERRKPGVTLELLHLEYLERHPDGYRYTQFCDIYRHWLKRKRLTMRQVHRAGEKLFVDYAGQKPRYINPATGEVIEVQLFVAVLGASNFTYAEATRTQRIADWIASHRRALDYIGGVPGALVPDQLKTGVITACRYEPGLQRTYESMAEHYGTAILPARPASPRDKAKVEVAVQIAERWILARLRNETFFSLAALNDRIAELLEDLNNRKMRLYGESRRELFDRLDRPALKPLPPEHFPDGEWKAARVNIDYHVEVDHHYYSVPHHLFHEKLDIWLTGSTVEAFHRGERVASHLRSSVRGRHTTVAEHMPKSHRKHLEWTPSRIIEWAGTIGQQTEQLARAIIADRPHPEQGYRSCLGILRLTHRYGGERVEAACGRALKAGARSYRHVDSILKNGLDRVAMPEIVETVPGPTILHENVRGGDYYQ